jgi:hypothetical protein
MGDDDGGASGPSGVPLADWRRAAGERRIDAVPAHLRERLASTAERLALTFAFAAQVHARMAGASGAEAGHHRAYAAWHQLIADFERRQADALRDGRLLATPWRPVPDAPGPRADGRP